MLPSGSSVSSRCSWPPRCGSSPAQFRALLSDDLWRVDAEHANRMARRLPDGVVGVEGVTVAYPVEANGVFAVIPPDVSRRPPNPLPLLRLG